jgi:glutathione synthase/RimK-type ligase-like ATP-grasp enzyme
MTAPRFRIAVQPDFLRLRGDPRQSFSTRWLELLEQKGHDAVVVDAFRPDIIAQLRDCDGFLWWFPPLPQWKEPGRRLAQALSHATDLLVFPDWRSAWHFEDKSAQSYLLQAAGIPTPETWMFWRERDALEFCGSASYPFVAKLNTGYYARNVRLLRTRREAERLVRRMFGRGLPAVGALPLSADRTLVPRLVHAARRAFRARMLTPPRAYERGYFLAQEFLPGNMFDTRVYVVGDRAFAVRRMNRPGDFRASGSGLTDADPRAIAEDAVALALHAAKTLKLPTLSCDILRRNGQPVISEISYYAEGWGISASPGHWRQQGAGLRWTVGKLRAEDVILDDVLHRLEARRRG